MVFNAARRSVPLTRNITAKKLVVLALALSLPTQALALGTRQTRLRQTIEEAGPSTLLGSYLAGRIARSSKDSENAARYYQRVLARDPANEEILDEAFQLELASGNLSEARGLATKLIRRQKDNIVAQLFLGIEAFKHKEFGTAEEHFKVAGRTAPSEPTIRLALAWTELAMGSADAAVARLNSPNKAAWATHFETVQRAFIADVGNKKAEAEKAYHAVYDGKAPNTRVAEGYARHLAHWGDKAAAEKVMVDSGADHTPMGKLFMAELKDNKPTKLMVTTVEEGMAEVFLGIGQVLASQNGVDAAQVYLRLALYLNPKSDIATMELAEYYGNIEDYEKANAYLDAIHESSPFWLTTQIRKALNLNSLQKIDESVTLLKSLLDKYPDNEQIPQTLASIEAARKKFEASLPYYDKAIAMIDKPEKKHWGLFYARGIAYERSKQWSKAEPDFKKSLELDPEQGAVLNYLGYSWIDQNIHVSEAFDLIKKAVKLRPNDGFIIDSLGWAYYVQKNYDEAVKYCERAVELRPEDPTLNDHLGDAYFRVGRKIEARFQWDQALTLNPEAEDAAKIQAKLAHGGLEDGPEVKQPATASTEPAAVAKKGEPIAAATRQQ